MTPVASSLIGVRISLRRRSNTHISRPYHTQRYAVLFIGMYVALVLHGCSLMGASERTPPPVIVPEVIQMSKAKVPADAIIEKMRESGMAYRLTASQIADLHEQGVPDPVLDYMQQTYLNAERYDQALVDWNRWSWADGDFWYGGWPYGWPREWWSAAREEHEERTFDHARQARGEQQVIHERPMEGHAGRR